MAGTLSPLTGEKTHLWGLQKTQIAFSIIAFSTILIMSAMLIWNVLPVAYMSILNAFAALSVAMSLAIGLRANRQDPVTGTLLRDSFDKKLNTVIASTRPGSGGCLILVELTMMNALKTEAKEDDIVAQLATSLKTSGKKLKIASRFGLSTIALLTEDQMHSDKLHVFCSDLRDKARADLHKLAPNADLVLTFGAYPFRETVTHYTSNPIERALQALGQAHDKPSRVCIYDATLEQKLRIQAQTEKAILRALAENDVEVHYQPIMDICSEKLVGCEALVRIRDEHDVLIPPELFLEIAEKTGLIEALGERVLDQIAADAPRIRGMKPTPYVSINIADDQFNSWPILEKKLDALIAANLRISLELTEKAASENSIRLASFRARGVTIAINDFGVGLTSIARLQNVSADVLKIDRSLTEHLSSNKGFAIVESMVRLARATSTDLVIVGVETPRQLLRALKTGARQCQGNIYSKPLTLDRLLAWSNQDKDLAVA